MEVKNCVECGKLFLDPRSRVCLDCVRRHEREFEQIYSYVRDNPGCSVDDVVRNTQVARKRVLQFVREGRLHGDLGKRGRACAGCGAPIAAGNYCPRCRPS